MTDAFKKIQFSDLNLLDVGHTLQIAGAVWQGDGRTILCIFPHVEEGDFAGHDPELLIMSVDEWTQFLRQTDLLETEVLAQLPDGKIGKSILRKSQRQVSQNVSWEVFRRDGYACRYCGNDKVPLTVDHLVLWEEGGPSIAANLFSSCKRCNSARGNTPYAQWITSTKYDKLSRRLSDDVKRQNVAVMTTLADIPRMVHKPKHR